jgi:uncharacterized protein (DUF2267 family)
MKSRAVLHVLRDRLPVPEAAHFGAQLPMLVRGFYYDNWKPATAPKKIKTAQEFYDAVRQNFAAGRNVNPMRLFPPELRALWPKPESVDLSDLG